MNLTFTDDLLGIMNDLFNKEYSIKGLEVHKPTSWNKAASHCQMKNKTLFYPKNWDDVVSVEREIEKRIDNNRKFLV